MGGAVSLGVVAGDAGKTLLGGAGRWSGMIASWRYGGVGMLRTVVAAGVVSCGRACEAGRGTHRAWTGRGQAESPPACPQGVCGRVGCGSLPPGLGNWAKKEK